MRASKAIVLPALLLWGAVSLAIWRNASLVDRAADTDDPRRKILLLRSAAAIDPLDYRAPYELGKAHFDSALQNAGDGSRSEADLRLSVADLRRSVRLNPYWSFGHFQLGQSLLYMGTVSGEGGHAFLEEFRKAVSLADYNSQFLLEVGRTCLMRWAELSEDERSFAKDVLKKLLNKRDPDTAQIAFQTWAMNSGDFEIIRAVMPEDPDLQRAYADFLAGRSMSVTERQFYLSKAELLEFRKANEELLLAENALAYWRLEQAATLLDSSLGRLRKIRFYQDLRQEKLIDPPEYGAALRSCWLDLAKCGIESGRKLDEVLTYLENYLSLEDRISSLNELETYLVERGLIEEKNLGDADNAGLVAFRLRLLYKRNRYLEVVRWGRSFHPMVVPEPKKKAMVSIFQILGDASQRAGYLYDSREFYARAYEIDPSNVETLVRMKASAERLNSEAELKEWQELIRQNVSPSDQIHATFSIGKGDSPSWRLFLEGRPVSLTLHFSQRSLNPPPLLSVVFNNRVVWEAYADREALTLPLKPDAGENLLEIRCLNATVNLDKLAYH